MQIYKSIFGERFNDINYIDEVVSRYPYFSIALLCRLQLAKPSDPDYNNLAAKTAIHFNNPLLLQYRLQYNIPSKLKPLDSSPVIKNELGLQSGLEKPLFEPLYTSDYFASQGIKLSEEIKTDDKLGKQLKSFTEWLKTMKKVHKGQKEEAIVIDTAVEKLAENSNREE